MHLSPRYLTAPNFPSALSPNAWTFLRLRKLPTYVWFTSSVTFPLNWKAHRVTSRTLTRVGLHHSIGQVFAQPHRSKKTFRTSLLPSIAQLRSTRLTTPKASEPLTPLHPAVTWTLDYLASSTNHELLGFLPRKRAGGETSNPIPLKDDNPIVRRRARRKARFPSPKQSSVSQRFTLFKAFLHRKHFDGSWSITNYSDRKLALPHPTKIRRISRKTRSRPRFKPYHFMGLVFPNRVLARSPFRHFSKFLLAFASRQRKRVSNTLRDAPIHRFNLLPSRPYSNSGLFKNKINYTLQRRLPRRIKNKVRWGSYRNWVVKIRNRHFANEVAQVSVLNSSFCDSFITTPFSKSPGISTTVSSLPHLSSQGSPVKSYVLLRKTGGTLKVRVQFALLGAIQCAEERTPKSGKFSVTITSRKQLRLFYSHLAARQLAVLLRTWTTLAKAAQFRNTYLRSELGIRLTRTQRKANTVLVRALENVEPLHFPVPTTKHWQFSQFSATHLQPTLPAERILTSIRGPFKEQPDASLFKNYSNLYAVPNKAEPVRKVFAAPEHFANQLRTFLRRSTLPQIQMQLSTAINPLRAGLQLPKFRSYSHQVSTLTGESRMRLTPTHSRTFRRSLFFFLNLLVSVTPSSLDLVASRLSFKPAFRCRVFPDANLIKVAVFRRLNKQKFLFRSRELLFNDPTAITSYRDYSRKKLSSSRIMSPRNPLLASYAQTTLASKQTHLAYMRMHELERRKPKKVKIQRVRFKPGYGRIWRTARNSIREIANLPARYQYRLTPKLHWLYLQTRRTSKNYTAIGLDYLLMSSHFLPDFWCVRQSFSTQSIFLNGNVATNSNIKVFVNDLVQLAVNLKFYVVLKWIKNWSQNKRNRVNKVFYRKFKPSGTNKDYKFARPLPTWFFDLQFTHRSIPQNVEVDFFTLSIFVVHDKLTLDLSEPTRANLYDSPALNMYNWKYIT